ncbi:MAG: polysaccharide biosynthesis C-terminal domain-containing protein, partial [Deltaproteobacteria bacterium]|nr:polysaccharide biosynthesis C-terminal domain-containing protein [Deltaproteobacteria bacterium]
DWKKFRSNSLYFMGIRSLNLLKHHLDTLVIGYYLSFREIALYSVVIEISTVIRKVRMGLEPMLMPYIKKVGYHTKRYGDEVRSLLYFMSMCSLILVLGLCFYADFWFQLFGSSFKADSWVLIFLALSQYMFAVFGVLEIALYMYGESRAAFEQNVLMLVLNLVFTLLLIHPYGIYGAAFSTLLATIITSMVTLKRHHTVTQIHVFDLTFFGHVLLAIGAIGFYKTMHISSNKGIISHTYAIFFIGLFVYGFYKRVMLQRKA